MSDLREAFEAWYNEEYVRPILPADRTEGGYQHPDAQAAWDAWQAALSANGGEASDILHVGFTNPAQIGYAKDESGFFYPDTDNQCYIPLYMMKRHLNRMGPDYTHPAPPSVAVPEGVDLDLVSAVLEDYANLQTSGAIPCANRYPASDVNEQAELLDMLTAGPSPDRIAEGGEVIGDHYDLGVALSRYFDDLRDPETGHIAFDPCDSNDIDELLKTISAHLSPAQSVEEIQAGALDAILIDISNLPVVDWSTVSGYLTREAARLRQSSDGDDSEEETHG
ncbi:hypothetical protein [uncultured Alcanivorax sp.]|uniref:hypothetical protein n=1 Tax=uncultured Alcanivorax sp. TaxID=191215 RepID=UPI0032B2BE17